MKSSIVYKELRFSGHSMAPVLRPGDYVYIDEKVNKLKLGDIIVFYQNQEFVAHRVISLNPLTSKGDNSFTKELVDIESVFGLVKLCKRKKRYYQMNNSKINLFIMFLSKLILIYPKLRRFIYVGLILISQLMRYPENRIPNTRKD